MYEDMKLNRVCDSDISYMVIFSCCASKVALSHQTKKARGVKHCTVKRHSPTEADNCSDIRLEVVDFAEDLMSV